MPSPGERIALRSEMFWRSDPEVTAATKLPKWGRFHRACGEKRLFFDHIERQGKRGQYQCIAFRAEKNRFGGWDNFHVATGTGATVLAALGDAFAKSGYDVPEAAELLAAGLQGDRAPPPPVEDDFDSLIEGDSFEDLL